MFYITVLTQNRFSKARIYQFFHTLNKYVDLQLLNHRATQSSDLHHSLVVATPTKFSPNLEFTSLLYMYTFKQIRFIKKKSI